jgi:membrane protein DedA with SNARE-associated domain
MKHLVSAAVGSILRAGLMFCAGWLVQHSVWSESEASTYVNAAVMVLLSLGWSLWAHYKGRVKFLTALELPSYATEADVTAAIANGEGASAREKK